MWDSFSSKELVSALNLSFSRGIIMRTHSCQSEPNLVEVDEGRMVARIGVRSPRLGVPPPGYLLFRQRGPGSSVVHDIFSTRALNFTNIALTNCLSRTIALSVNPTLYQRAEMYHH